MYFCSCLVNVSSNVGSSSVRSQELCQLAQYLQVSNEHLFLADHTNCAYGTVLCLSVVCNVVFLAKRCILPKQEAKLSLG